MSKLEMKKTENGKGKFVSLAVRIPTIVVGAVLVVVVIICIAFGVLTIRSINDLAKKQISNVARENVLTIQKYMDGMNIYADTLGDSVMNYRNLGREDGETAIIEALTRAVESGKIFSAYFAFEPNAFFSDTDNGLSYYVYKSGNGTATDILNDFDSYGEADYYAPTKASLKTHLTDPYEYELSDGTAVWLITLSTPIVENGKFIGVANCDMLLDTLKDLDYTNGNYKTSYMTITDDKNTYIVHSKTPEAAGQVVDYNEGIVQRVLGGETVIRTDIQDKIDGAMSFVVFTPVLLEGSDLQWVLTNIVHRSEVYAPVYTSLLIIIVIGIIGIAVLAFVAFSIVRSALAPIKPLMKTAEDVGEFRLSDAQNNYEYPNNEFGKLADTFLSMSDNLKSIISDVDVVLSGMAEGDFTANSSCPEKYVGDMKNALMSINSIQENLGNTLKDISESAERVAVNSSQISDGSQALAQGATEQAGSVQELSGTINNVSEEVRNNADNAGNASTIALRTKEAIAASNEEMSKLTASMDSIEEASNKIQDVISIIDNIAFQTNILSLNAAIEAARAGQAGKGFAVVADEVGNLAKRSQEAAQSTSDLIQMVTEAVDRGKGITDDTAEALERVSGYADETNDMIKDISEASINQSEALEQISIGIGQISEVVQTNSSTSEQSAAASIELANEANKLKEIVKPFKLR
ncbi:methyl-accepting chemotaxis protein [Oribacterium sp. FC2011]|uniref:methyl-accepting chemotaxis protein n=1 Tax=Oribacterium sp. FC2011 TaxID=1408311 RepID=UPI0004E1D3E2|nr:methyl-accepting chemotaxis protein [Oribacterium sp. FC2011]